MTLDLLNQANEILQTEKGRWPRWRSPLRKAPSWFSGEELDLLDPAERVRLYQEFRSRSQAAQWVPIFIALGNLANAVRGFRSDAHRPLWAALAVGFVLVTLGAWLYRRRSIVGAARRILRESADWPLRLQRRGQEGSV